MKYHSTDPARNFSHGFTGVSITGFGSPPAVSVEDSTINAWATLKFSPGAPTVTLTWDSGNPTLAGILGAAAAYSLSRGTAMATPRFLRLWAKRRATATGAIRAQTISIQSHDGTSYVTIGRIDIAATAAGTAEPVATWHDIIRANADDTRITFLSANPLKFVSSLTTITGGAIEETDNVYTKTGHGLVTGDAVSLTSLTGGTGLTAGTLYYFHRLTDDTGYLCSSATNAAAGTAINVTLDASSVVLTPVDTNLELCLEAAGIAS